MIRHVRVGAMLAAACLITACQAPLDLVQIIQEEQAAVRLAVVTAPQAPSELVATAVSASQIDLTWTDNSDNEESFEVQRDAGSGFTGIQTLSADSSAHSDTGLEAERSYTYRVRAVNSTGESEWSASVGATTLPIPTYTVTYDGNGADGGSPPVDSKTYSQGEFVTVSGPATMTRTDNTFVGWNTAADGGGTEYLIGATLVMGESDVTLYAQWTAGDTYRVIYDGRGADGGTVPTDQNNYPENTWATVLGPGTMTLTGHTYVEWNDQPTGTGTSYTEGEIFLMPANDKLLFAMWSVNQYTLSYNDNGADGGSVPSGGTYDYDETVTPEGPGSLYRTGYAFDGWNSKANGTGTDYTPGVDFSMPAEDLTLYAQWDDPFGPTVVSRAPDVYEPDHPRDEGIEVEFNEDIDAATLTSASFEVWDVTIGQAVGGDRAFQSATNTALFAAASQFDPTHEYRVTLTTDIRDQAGNPLDAEYQWYFTAKAADTSTTNVVIEMCGLDVGGGNVAAYVLVMDQDGTPIEGLSRYNFEITEDSTSVDFASMTKQRMGDSGKPKNVSVIMDNSMSVSSTGLEVQKQALYGILGDSNYFGANDSWSIHSLGNYPNAMQLDFASDESAIGAAIDGVFSYGQSIAYDTTYAALGHHASSGLTGMNAVLFSFDGDTGSGNQPLQIGALSRDTNILVYPYSFRGNASPEEVDTLTTGGYQYYTLTTFSGLMISELQAQYGMMFDRMDMGYVLSWSQLGTGTPVSITVTYTAENGSWSASDSEP